MKCKSIVVTVNTKDHKMEYKLHNLTPNELVQLVNDNQPDWTSLVITLVREKAAI